MRKALVALFVVVLMSQPVLALGGVLPIIDAVGIPAALAADPERGCRYSGADLTNHVPIFINGTSDFESQGWPGTGSPESPYVIERLNITYDVGLVGIRILETDAYFVIRDCYVKQVSDLKCIQLYNTSHAAIEYTTAISEYATGISSAGSIACDYTNNLRISRSIATGQSTIGARIHYADDTVLRWNLLTSVSYWGLDASSCNNLLSEHNEYVTLLQDGAAAAHFSCDRATSQYDYSHENGMALYFNDCEDVVVTRLRSDGNRYGVYTVGTPRIQIGACHITDIGLYGMILMGAPNSTVGDCIIEQETGIGGGIRLEDSPGTEVTNCSVTNIGDIGIILVESPSSVVDHCTVADCGSGAGDDAGIWALLSPDTNVTNNEIRGTDGVAIAVSESDRSIVEHNEIYETSDYGMILYGSENVTVVDNDIIEGEEYGLLVRFSDHAIVESNVLDQAGATAMYFDDSDYAYVYGNDIWDSPDIGIWIDGGVEAYIEQNTVGLCEVGIDVRPHTNATVSYNTISHALAGVNLQGVAGTVLTHNTITDVGGGVHASEVTHCRMIQNTIQSSSQGIFLDVAQDTDIADNIIRGSGAEGITVQGSLNLTFDGNQLTECGFMLSPGGSIEDYSHSFADNTVNGRPVYYRFNTSDVAIAGSSVGQLILVACENVNVTGGVFSLCTIPVQAFFSESLRFMGMTSNGNLYGFRLQDTENCTVSGATITHTDYGVYATACNYLTVENSDISRAAEGGIRVDMCLGVTIRGVTVEYAPYGVSASTGPNGIIDDCKFNHLSGTGIAATMAAHAWNVTHCEFFNVTYGVSVASVLDWYIADSLFGHCSRGVNVAGDSTDQGTVVRSEFYSNGVAVYVLSGDYWHIINCTILWSSQYGIWLSGVVTPEIYGNVIALSGTANGYADSDYDWDDGVSVGNSWDDYVPPPPYHINGGGGGENVLENGVPVTSSLPAQYATEMWTITVGADAVSMYTVLDGPAGADFDVYGRLGAEPTTSTYDWRGYAPGDDAVTFSSPGAGTWYIMVRSYSGTGSYTLTVTVTYEDGGAADPVDNYPSLFLPTEPIMDSPMDVSYPEFSTGNYISWLPYDDSLRDWRAEVDGVVWASGAWKFERIYVNIDGLSYGTHTIAMTVWDVDQNSRTDEVTIEVYDDIAPTISHLPNTDAFVGGSGQALTWEVSDLHPGDYEILSDDVVVGSGSWATGNISISLDTLSEGLYDYTIYIYDSDGNSAHDEVTVVVLVDHVAPTIDSPVDDVIVIGTAGNYITWTPEDDHPKRYEVTKDGLLVESGAWAGSRIAFSIDGLEVGNYSFTLTVYDGAGYSASDSVAVRVMPYAGYVEGPVFDLMTLAIAGAAIGGVVVVVALVYHFRKRGK